MPLALALVTIGGREVINEDRRRFRLFLRFAGEVPTVLMTLVSIPVGAFAFRGDSRSPPTLANAIMSALWALCSSSGLGIL